MICVPLHLDTAGTRRHWAAALTVRLAPWQAQWLHLPFEVAVTQSGPANSATWQVWQEGNVLRATGSTGPVCHWLFSHMTGFAMGAAPLPVWATRWASHALHSLVGALFARVAADDLPLQPGVTAPGTMVTITLTSALGVLSWYMAAADLALCALYSAPPTPAALQPWRLALAQTRLELDCMLPSATLPVAALALLEAGDVIQLDIPVQTRLSLWHHGLTIAHCEITDRPGPFLCVTQLLDEAPMNDQRTVDLPAVALVEMANTQPTNINQSARRLDPLKYVAELDVSLDFRIGRASLTIGELAQLQPGSHVQMNEDQGLTVQIYANGHLLGAGALVRLNDALAVQITQLAVE